MTSVSCNRSYIITSARANGMAVMHSKPRPLCERTCLFNFYQYSSALTLVHVLQNRGPIGIDRSGRADCRTLLRGMLQRRGGHRCPDNVVVAAAGHDDATSDELAVCPDVVDQSTAAVCGHPHMLVQLSGAHKCAQCGGLACVVWHVGCEVCVEVTEDQSWLICSLWQNLFRRCVR